MRDLGTINRKARSASSRRSSRTVRTYVGTSYRMARLFRTLLAHMAGECQRYQSAIVFGDENKPFAVWLYTEKDPSIWAEARKIRLDQTCIAGVRGVITD